MNMTRNIIRTEGIRGLFRGLTTTFMRECPGYGCFFGGYELTRSLLISKNQKKEDIGNKKRFFIYLRNSNIFNRFYENMDIWWNGGYLFLVNYVSY